MLLVAFLFSIGSVASMGTEVDPSSTNNPAVEKNGWFGSAVTNDRDESTYIEEFSHQTVIDLYSDVFFNEKNQAANVFLKEDTIKLVKDEDSTNVRDYKLTATMLDNVRLTDGDSVVIMAFVETEDTYSLLTIPKNLSTPWLRWFKFRLPYTGKDKPNHVRVVAFLKSQWKALKPGENLEITDLLEIIESENPGFNLKASLKNSRDTIKQVENILQ